MTELSTIISNIGFPITACIGLAYFCKYMIDKNNVYVEKMLNMYDQANRENREAIEACTKAIERLCDKLDKEDKT